MNRWTLSAAFLLVAAFPRVPTASAQPLQVPPGRWWQRPEVIEELGLTPDQQAKIDSVTLEHARTMIDLKATVEKAELNLRVVADAEPFNAEKVREAFRALVDARSRLEAERFEMLITVRESLNGVQWQKLKEMARERLERIRGGDEAQERVGPRPLRPRR